MSIRNSNSLDLYDYKSHINYLLSKHEPEQVFSLLVQDMLAYYNRPVHTLTELKKRDLKQSVGRTWELFCKDWLLAQRNSKGVPLYVAVHDAVDKKGELGLGKQDIGIDLVAEARIGNKTVYHAIQCKWRKKGLVTWTQLSTFLALCSRTGPWVCHRVMTNSTGVNWKKMKGDKDRCTARGTFAATDRLTWMATAGVQSQGHVLGSTASNEASSSTDIDVVTESLTQMSVSKSTVDIVREARLKRFVGAVVAQSGS